MKYKIFYLCVFLIYSQSICLSQVLKRTISGFVTDAKTGERLPYANVYDKISGKDAVANNYGFYSITIIGDSAEIHYSYVGYSDYFKIIKIDSELNLNIELIPDNNIEEVVILSDRNKYINTEFHRLSVKEVEKIPLAHW